MTKEEHLEFEVYEAFFQADPLSAHVHVFNVLASSPEMALALAEANFFRRQAFCNLWVVPRQHIYQLKTTDREGYQKSPKTYRTTEDYKYLRDKWRYYRENPMSTPGEEGGTVGGTLVD